MLLMGMIFSLLLLATYQASSRCRNHTEEDMRL